jgi:hypothetical protein
LDFFAAYGGCCACCGEDDVRFLSLDHVENDGNEHRKTYNCQQIYWLAKKEGYPKDKYQLLCHNCNMGKSINKGVCPHKCGVSKAQAREEMESHRTFIGRSHLPLNAGNFTGGPDPRRM